MNFGRSIQSILPLSITSVRRTRSLGRTSLSHQLSQITTNHFYVLDFLCHFLLRIQPLTEKLIDHANLKKRSFSWNSTFRSPRLTFELQILANSPSSNSLPWKKNVRRECPVRRHRSICVSLSRSGHLRRMRYACVSAYSSIEEPSQRLFDSEKAHLEECLPDRACDEGIAFHRAYPHC